MNKTELIAEVAKKCGMSKKDAEKAVTTTFDTITEALSQGDKVQLVGFGGFETKKREARMGRNPKTKEAIEIPATTIPVFKAGKALKEKTFSALTDAGKTRRNGQWRSFLFRTTTVRMDTRKICIGN